jgi:hypothetical protein
MPRQQRKGKPVTKRQALFIQNYKKTKKTSFVPLPIVDQEYSPGVDATTDDGSFERAFLLNSSSSSFDDTAAVKKALFDHNDDDDDDDDSLLEDKKTKQTKKKKNGGGLGSSSSCGNGGGGITETEIIKEGVERVIETVQAGLGTVTPNYER